MGSNNREDKRPYGDVPPTWVAKSASWYINDPLCRNWYMNGSIFQFFQKFEPNWFNLRKLEEKKSGDFGQNLALWYMNGSLFLGKLVYVWAKFQISRGTFLPKQKLSYLPPPPP